MKYILVKYKGCQFLIPESDNFTSEYLARHKTEIEEYVAASNNLVDALVDDPLSHKPSTAALHACIKEMRWALTDFKAYTHIIGFPFDLHDIDLFIANHQPEIALVIDLS